MIQVSVVIPISIADFHNLAAIFAQVLDIIPNLETKLCII